MGFHWSSYAAVLVGCGAVDVAAAVSVWRRRGITGRNSLCVVLLAAAVWSVAYALALAAVSSLTVRDLGGIFSISAPRCCRPPG